MARNLRFLPPIPEGMHILSADREVMGIEHRLSDAVAFAKESSHKIEFEREPDNPHDKNAIKVIGISKRWFFFETRAIYRLRSRRRGPLHC
jgi:hypothetical protein